MPTKLYDNETWMRRRYVTQGKTPAEIAAECKVSEATIYRRLQAMGLIKK